MKTSIFGAFSTCPLSLPSLKILQVFEYHVPAVIGSRRVRERQDGLQAVTCPKIGAQ